MKELNPDQNTEQEVGLGRKLIAGNGKHLDHTNKTIVTYAHHIIQNELRTGE